GKEAEAAHRAELDALLEEDLHADADPEKGPTRERRVADDVDEAGRLQVLDAGTERTHPRQHDSVRTPDVARIAAHPDLDVASGLVRRALEALGGAPQIADAVVDDRDHRMPLVESTPWMRGSIAVAASRARASPLNAASIMWWGFRPRTQSTCRFI